MFSCTLLLYLVSYISLTNSVSSNRPAAIPAYDTLFAKSNFHFVMATARETESDDLYPTPTTIRPQCPPVLTPQRPRHPQDAVQGRLAPSSLPSEAMPHTTRLEEELLSEIINLEEKLSLKSFSHF